jgi:hypothetical protein
MSKEIIEAVYKYSNRYLKQMMLICSRNQVDYESGYVFTTDGYQKYIEQMKRKYPHADVIICRDHCGPGFGTSDNTLESVMETIRCDIESGFDLIHIDLCHMDVPHKEKIRQTMDLMRFARSIRWDIMFEIGTDENRGKAETDVKRIVSDIKACQQIANPIFYVVQTGSLVWENLNIGLFRADAVREMHAALHGCGTKLKEHNADYLTTEQIRERRGIVDAVNIAPQLGVIQTSLVLSKALTYGINPQAFINEVDKGGRWKKWHAMEDNRHLSALVAGHYHFGGPAYKQLIDQLGAKIPINECIVKEITRAIEHYLFAME